jgi:lysophospholipase L1-like esterase
MPVSDRGDPADAPPDPAPTPVGMVDRLDSSGFGPTPEQLEFAKAYVTDGEMNPALLTRLATPGRAEENERVKAWRFQRDWAALGQYRDANAALEGRAVEVVFMGDSITEMWRIARPELFEGARVNRGISGQTSPQMLLRFMADVVALKPRLVHLMCGANDVAGNTGPTTPQDFRNNIVAMLDIAGAHGIAAILGSLPPFATLAWSPAIGDARPRVAELNGWLEELAAERGLVFADYFSALNDGEGRMRMEFTRDGIHPTGRGYAAMEPVLMESLHRIIA